MWFCVGCLPIDALALQFVACNFKVLGSSVFRACGPGKDGRVALRVGVTCARHGAAQGGADAELKTFATGV